MSIKLHIFDFLFSYKYFLCVYRVLASGYYLFYVKTTWVSEIFHLFNQNTQIIMLWLKLTEIICNMNANSSFTKAVFFKSNVFCVFVATTWYRQKN